MRFCVVALLACLSLSTAACSGDSSPSASPTGPSPTAGPTTTAVTITSGTDLLLIGTSETFAATVTLSNGTSRPASPSWSSSNPAIVSIDGSGRATARAAGVATVTVSAGGRTATVVVRGLPDFAGNWRVQIRQLACDVPPRWGAGFCNVSGLVTMSLRLSRADGDRVVGTVNNGIGWTGSVSGAVSIDGALMLSGRLASVRPRATFYSDYSEWRTRLSPALGMTGTFREILTWVGERDQGFVVNEIVRASR